MEPISISAMVVAFITALGVLLSRLKFKHCLCGCIESDCINTPPNTPENTPHQSVADIDDIFITYPSTSV